jgi:hypothetical protein
MKIFDVYDNRLFPETDVEKIKALLEGLDKRQRDRFEAEVNYPKERPRLAA